MNGMRRKAAKRRHAIRYDEDGLPRDPRDWTPADWCSLHRAMQQVIREVGERHGKKVKR